MEKFSHVFEGDTSSLHKRVFDTIEESILKGAFEPGESLVESRICEELGVSRTPVREAIRQLELEGLVESVPNKGSVVVGITDKDVLDIFSIRILIEGLAARWAAKNIAKEQLSTLKEAIDLQEFYTNKSDMINLEKYDSVFHDIIYEASNSRQLELMLSNFHHMIKRARGLSFERENRADLVMVEHRAVYDAIASGNAVKAEKCMNAHIKNARDNYIK
jgi:DNA-binding GntR family transcriptional regulator